MVTMMWSLPSGDLQPHRGDRQVDRLLQHSSGSQSGSQPSSIHLPWELIRNVASSALPETNKEGNQNLEVGPSICVLTSPPGDADTHSCLRSTV